MYKKKFSKIYQEEEEEEQLSSVNEESQKGLMEEDELVSVNRAMAQLERQLLPSSKEEEENEEMSETPEQLVAEEEEEFWPEEEQLEGQEEEPLEIELEEEEALETEEDLAEELAEAAEEQEEDPLHLTESLEEEQESRKTTAKGRLAPVPEEGRDPTMDEDPLEAEDLGLPEDSILVDRRLRKEELQLQMNAQSKDFLGSNMHRTRDFAAIFAKGKSSKEDPKLDLAYEIDQNLEYRKELVAQQLLRNFHSADSKESYHAGLIFKELGLTDKDDEDFADDVSADSAAHENEEFIEQIRKRLPNL
ncbi:hypothetical protein SapgrDRAFT_3060 [Saprospira grandis DSM 2844]|uniref:Uncharacterized protein n=1 Tax=Saprospira grandis DSM 2844 TaxID=694433 RepID=J0P4C9_9BACT|nr:hypothetical protein [Saprospira grandis]EJF54709.1 hypothetical protein SapgrDRAFT_3060 [Saprospira grandis DSM 2844]